MENVTNITSQRPSLRCLQNIQSGRCSALSNLDNVSTLASILVFYWCHRPNKKFWDILVQWEPIWENQTCIKWFQHCSSSNVCSWMIRYVKRWLYIPIIYTCAKKFTIVFDLFLSVSINSTGDTIFIGIF